MIEQSATPEYQYIYGDIESFALTIDVFPDGEEPYQARAWEDGGTSALQYFTSFSECVAWFSTFPTPLPHDCEPGHEPKVVGLAPQSEDGGQTVAWTLIDNAHIETWFDGSDFPDGKIGDAQIIFFSEMAEPPASSPTAAP